MAKRKKSGKSWNVSTPQSGKPPVGQSSTPANSEETNVPKAAMSSHKVKPEVTSQAKPGLPVPGGDAKKAKFGTAAGKDTTKVVPKPTNHPEPPKKKEVSILPPFPSSSQAKAIDNTSLDKKAVDNKVVDQKVVDNKATDKKVVDDKIADNKVVVNKLMDKVRSKAKPFEPGYMNPANSRKPHKLIRDPRIFARIQEYLDSRSRKNFVSIPLMAEYLQAKYPEYARKKKSVFAQYVDRAYEIMSDPTKPSSEEEGEGDSDLSPLSDDEDYVNKGKKHESGGHSNGKRSKGTMEIAGTDSDAGKDEKLADYKDTNAVNNMMSSLYRNSTARPSDKKRKSETPSEDNRREKVKIMYPSPHVLNRNLHSSGLLGPRRNSNDKYFLDRVGSIKPPDDKKTEKHKPSDPRLPLKNSGNKNSRENNIQQFMGNLPSRTSFASFISPDRDPRQNLYRVHLDKDPLRNEQRICSESGISKDNTGVSVEPPASPTSNDQADTTVTGNVFFQKTEKTNAYKQDSYSVSHSRNGSEIGEKLPENGAGVASRKQQPLATPAAKEKSPKKRFKTGSKSTRRGEEPHDDSSTVSAGGPDVQKSTITFADVGGNEDNLKEICKLLVHMRHPEVYQQLGVTPPQGFLLHGPPGCGKTLLANAIAGLPFIKLASTELVSGVSGESEGKIRDLFDKAMESAPCVLFIDEIDAITPKRETASKEMERRIVAQLLACMDDLNANADTHVLVIGATNRADSLDPALRRAGRFDREICLGIPDEPSRLRILQVLCRAMRLAHGFDFAYLAHNSPGYVGADLMALTREAAMTAVNRVFNEIQFSNKQQAVETDHQPDNGNRTERNCTTEMGNQSRLIPVDCDTIIGANLLTWLRQKEGTRNSVTGTEVTKPTSKEKQLSSITGEPTNKEIDLTRLENEPTRDNKSTSKENELVCKEKVHSSHNMDIASVQDESGDISHAACTGNTDTEAPTQGMDMDTTGVTGHMGVAMEVTIVETREMENVSSKNVDIQHSDISGVNRLTAEVKSSDKVANNLSASSGVSDETKHESDYVTNNKNIASKVKEVSSPKDDSLVSMLSWLKEYPPLTQEQLKDLYITMEDFKEALGHVQPSAKREGFATIPGVTWEDVGALHEVREELQLAIVAPVRHAEQFRSLGLNHAQGILLAGPPGCGKTLLAKAIANESGINFISVKGPELLNMYVGESERAVRTVFQRARNSVPCVIFFDELDALCPRRSHDGESGSSSRVVNQLLTEMDGLEERKQVFIMAATNRPDIIDPAVLRPGRLDKTLYVGLPSTQDRLDILRCITKNGTKPALHEDVVLSEIAEDPKCDRYTGADLAAIVREASVIALKGAISGPVVQPSEPIVVRRRDFDAAFRKIRPSVSDKDLLIYKHMKTNISV